jgi:hypothetical protein
MSVITRIASVWHGRMCMRISLGSWATIRPGVCDTPAVIFNARSRFVSVTPHGTSSSVKLTHMSQFIAWHSMYIGRSPFPISATCKTRTDLLDRLAGTLSNLRRATVKLSSAVESGDTAQSRSVQIAVERLRKDCSSIRAELQEHRATHGC